MARISRTTRTAQAGWRVFITPGWVITFLLVISFSYAAFTILSPWQLGKDAQIVNRNNHIEDAFNVDPKPYSDIFTSDGVIKDDQEWMRVTLTGRYLTDKEVILRLRPVELDSGEIILVNRGFEPTTADKETTIPPAPTGEVTILAHARVNEQQPQTAPRTDVDPKQVYGINTEQIGQIEGLTLAKDYVQLSDDQPGLLHFIPIPKLDRGNHLSYGFQWIAFGIMAPLGFGYFLWSEARERRKLREEEAEMAAQTAGTPESGPDPEPAADPAAPTVSAARPTPASQSPADDRDEAHDSNSGRTDTAQGSRPRRSRYGNQHPNHYEKFAKRDDQRF